MTGTTPLPFIDKDCELDAPTRVTISVADSKAKVDGVNATVILQLFPAPSVLGLSGQFPPKAKSIAFEPLIVIRPIATATVWAFLNVTVFGALVSLTT